MKAIQIAAIVYPETHEAALFVLYDNGVIRVLDRAIGEELKWKFVDQELDQEG